MALAAATLLAVVCAAVVLVVDAFSSDSAARWGAF
jgi:hypothetical protein